MSDHLTTLANARFYMVDFLQAFSQSEKRRKNFLRQLLSSMALGFQRFTFAGIYSQD